MKKNRIFILLAVLAVIAGAVLIRPYVAISMDEWGFALRTRTSVHEKFHPQPLISFPSR